MLNYILDWWFLFKNNLNFNTIIHVYYGNIEKKFTIIDIFRKQDILVIDENGVENTFDININDLNFTNTKCYLKQNMSKI
jgi:hypothetical protein